MTLLSGVYTSKIFSNDANYNQHKYTYDNNITELMFSKYNTSQTSYSENLKQRFDKPEISSEADLPEGKLIELKQSPARQEISKILHSCDDKAFAIQDKEIDQMNLIIQSGIGKTFNFEEIMDKFLVNKTDRVISVIQGIDQLDTGKMTESEMKAKASEFSKIIEQEKVKMETFRKLLDEGAKLAKKVLSGEKNTAKKELDKEIKEFGKKFTAFVQDATSNSSEKAQENSNGKQKSSNI